MRTPILILAIGALAYASHAQAQDLTDGWETKVKADLVIAVTSMDDVERLPTRSALGEARIQATAEKTLQNSAEIGLRFAATVQQDNPARAGFSGNVEPFDNIPVTTLVFDPAQRGAFSGLTRNGPVEDASVTGSIETAQIYIDGGYGQVSAGYGRGVAARFHEGAPDVFTHVRAANPKLDPGGLNLVRTENDLTGPAPKITYQTPRIIGVRAGISYTPEANVAGVDRDPRRSVPGVVTPEITNVVEGAVQVSRKLTEQNVRIRASASYAQGEVSGIDPFNRFDGVTAWSVGAEAEFETLSIGAEYLSTNNGFGRNGDYASWSIGVTKQALGWNWGARYGEAEDENISAEGQNWSIGGARDLNETVRLAAGYHSNDVDLGQLLATDARSGNVSGPEGIVVEITLSF